METVKEFFSSLKKNMNDALEQGDVFLANEISANIMIGSVMALMALISLIALILNEVGVFTVNRASMRVAVLISLLVEIPAVACNSLFHGSKPWLKKVLPLDLVIQCAVLSACLGHNVTLLMALPVVLSVRYCDEKLTTRVAICTAVCFALASVYCGFFGVVNLNIVRLDATLNVSGTLRGPVMEAGFDRARYTALLFQHEFLPRFLIESVLAFACIRIAGYGKQTVHTQADITARSARIETELDLAQEIQTSMLPCIFPAFPEHKDIELYAFNIPAREVGGDFYDYFRIDDDRVALVMADVSGKGVPAALFMVIAKPLIKNRALMGGSPGEILAYVNDQLCEGNDAGLFVTVWLAILEISTGKGMAANAGHEHPALRRGDGTYELVKYRHSPAVATLEGIRFREHEFQMESGDSLFVYTDGVAEATDANNELFGEERTLAALNRDPAASPKDLLANVKEGIDTFVGDAMQFDDITMLGLHYFGPKTEET